MICIETGCDTTAGPGKTRCNHHRYKRAQILKDIAIPKSKFCTKCERTKKGIEFGRSTASKDGLSNYCKVCKRAKQKATSTKTKDKSCYPSDEYFGGINNGKWLRMKL